MKFFPALLRQMNGLSRAGTSTPSLTVAEAVPVLSLLLLLTGWELAPGVLERGVYLPLLISTVLFGIPHGALDHRLPVRLGWSWGRYPNLVRWYLLGYGLCAALTFSLWWFSPQLIFWGFLLLSLLHWGQGDLYHLEVFQGRRRAHRWSAPVTLLTRGSFPILLPLLAFPEWFARLASGIDQIVGRPARSGPLLPHGVFLALVALLLGLLVAYLWDLRLSSRRPQREMAETAVLLLVFALVPAPLSIGIYFSLWHAWRHLQRLLCLPTGSKAVGGRRVVRLAADLTPITLVALGLLVTLSRWAAPRLSSVETFAALYLALIAALTLPHAVVVACMGKAPATTPEVSSAGSGACRRLP